MRVFEATLFSRNKEVWSHLFLYPPSKKNLLAALKADETFQNSIQDFDRKEDIRISLELLSEYECPPFNLVEPYSFRIGLSPGLEIHSRNLRENRVY